jgi:hypothetical protein
MGTSHMSDNQQMSVAMQRLVDFISMVTNSTLLRHNTGANSTLLRNNTGTKYVTTQQYRSQQNVTTKLWKETATPVGSALTLQLGAVTEESGVDQVAVERRQSVQ